MIDSISIVVVDNGDTEPELWAFADSEQAERFAVIRGAVDVQSLPVMDRGDAEVLIHAEAKQRAEDERVDRELS